MKPDGARINPPEEDAWTSALRAGGGEGRGGPVVGAIVGVCSFPPPQESDLHLPRGPRKTRSASGVLLAERRGAGLTLEHLRLYCAACLNLPQHSRF